jgi:hypothetical protein
LNAVMDEYQPSDWVSELRDAPIVARAVCGLAGLGAVVALLVVVTTLVTDRPVHWAHWLLWPGIPVLVLGGIWTAAVVIPRERAARDPLSRWWSRRFMSAEDSRRLFFAGLPTRLAKALTALFVLLVITAVATMPSLISGGPASPSHRCRYRLVEAGDYTCVSHHTYVHVGAAVNRFGAAALGGLFILESGVAAGELALRRRSRPEPTA